MATFDDPAWVHEFLRILQRRKKVHLDSMAGANFDILELGGGSASSTVISPRLFDEFVAPYDAELIAIAHRRGQRIAYHTCGGMMALLERIAAMKPDAMETFTPAAMGGDARLAEPCRDRARPRRTMSSRRRHDTPCTLQSGSFSSVAERYPPAICGQERALGKPLRSPFLQDQMSGRGALPLS